MHRLQDVGLWLKKEIKGKFSEADIKYIDPTYMIRAIGTTSSDRIYCKVKGGWMRDFVLGAAMRAGAGELQHCRRICISPTKIVESNSLRHTIL